MRLAGIGLAAIMLQLAAVPAAAAAPDPRTMIRLAADQVVPAPATIGDLAWLEGSWVGHMDGIKVEHVILPAALGHMPSFVRAQAGDAIAFYEISVFVQAGVSVSSRVKHFSPALSGWEGREEYIDRPLLKRDGTTLYFDGMTFQRTSPDNFTVYFLDRTPEGQERRTLVIPFHRQTVTPTPD